jgi:hypothetical protein
MEYARGQWLTLVTTALIVAVLLHIDVIVNHFHASPDKVGVLIAGPRTDASDNYFYFTLLKHAPERFSQYLIRSDDPDGGDHRNTNALSNSYATALLTGHVIYRLAQLVTSTSRDAVLLTSILLTAVFAYCFTFFVLTLLNKKELEKPFLLFMLMAIGLVFIGFFAAGLHFGRFVWSNAVLDSYTTRILNPPLFWSIGLISGAFIIRWIRSQQVMDFMIAFLSVGMVGLFNINLSATLVCAIGFSLIFDFLVRHHISKKFVAIFVAAVAGLIWNYLWFQIYRASSLGLDLRHGSFENLVFTWQHLLLLVLIPLLWRIMQKERVFVIALLLSSIAVGVICESFHLGGRIWLRGAVIFEWGITVFLFFHLSVIWIAPGAIKLLGNIWPRLISVIALVVLILFLQQPNTNSWQGFIARDKWEIYNWINNHLAAGSVIASSDIEDAFLLPIYTNSKPLYTMRGLTNHSRDESIRRYLYNMELFGRKEYLIEQFLQLEQSNVNDYINFVTDNPQHPYIHETADILIFLRLVVYYQYLKDFSLMLINLNQRRQFEKILRDRAEEVKSLDYSYDYAILAFDSVMPRVVSNWKTVYQNEKYLLLRNPELSRFSGIH